MIYILVLLYTLFLVYKYDIKGHKKNIKFHYRFLLVTSIVLAGFSYRLGMDTVGYMEYFNRVDTDILYTITHLADLRYEPIPELLFSICKHIWDDFTLVQIIVGIFVNTTIFWFLRKHSPAFFFSIFLYFIYQYWNVNFEIKRESIAVALFLIAIDYILKDDSKKAYIKYYAISFFMLLCHKFAFVAFIYPFCLKFRISRTSMIVLAGILCMVIIASGMSTNFFFSLNFLFSFFNTEDVIKGYLDSDIYGSNDVSLLGYVFSIVIPVFLIYSVKNECDKKVTSLALLYIFVQIMSSQIFIFYRLTNYLVFFLFIVYSHVIQKPRNKNTFSLDKTVHKVSNIMQKPRRHIIIKTRRLMLLLVLLLIIYGKTHKDQYIRYLPYNSIFEKKYNSERESEYQRLSDIMN